MANINVCGTNKGESEKSSILQPKNETWIFVTKEFSCRLASLWKKIKCQAIFVFFYLLTQIYQFLEINLFYFWVEIGVQITFVNKLVSFQLETQ